MTFPHPIFSSQNHHHDIPTFIKYYSANPPKPRKGPLSIKPNFGHLRKFCNRKTRSHQIKFDLCRVFSALTNFCSVTGVTIF
jgi:hypothetical protein